MSSNSWKMLNHSFSVRRLKGLSVNKQTNNSNHSPFMLIRWVSTGKTTMKLWNNAINGPIIKLALLRTLMWNVMLESEFIVGHFYFFFSLFFFHDATLHHKVDWQSKNTSLDYLTCILWLYIEFVCISSYDQFLNVLCVFISYFPQIRAAGARDLFGSFAWWVT